VLYAALLKWMTATAGKNSPANGKAGESKKNGDARKINESVHASNAPLTLAAIATAEDTLMRLGREPGINVERGLATLRGNTAKYLELLRRFAVTHADDMTKLAESLDQGDQPTALRMAHTIKGAAATMGADRLSEMARLLEEKLRKPHVTPLRSDDIRPEMDKISHAFIVLLGLVPPLAVAPIASDSTPHNPEAFKKLLGELNALLELSDTSAITLLEENTALLRAALGPSFDRLANQIKDFEFDKACNTLQALD
jgi:two-component system sensor histidine kinase/response regulator